MSNGHPGGMDDSGYDPLLKVILSDAQQSPTQEQVEHRAPKALIDPLLGELFGMSSKAGGFVTRTEGTVGPGGQPIDLTDPSVHPGDAKLDVRDEYMRKMRFLGRAMKGAALTPGMPSNVGVERLRLEGQLNPKDKWEERIMSVAPLLASMGIFSVGGIASGIANAGKAVAPEAETLMGSLLGHGIIGGAARGILPGAAWGTIGGAIEDVQRAALLPPSAGGGMQNMPSATKELAMTPGRALTGAEFGAGMGAGLGVAGKIFGWVAGRVIGSTGGLSPRDQAHIADILESSGQGDGSPVVPGPGMVIDGMQKVSVRGVGQWRYTKDHPNYDETNPYKFVKKEDVPSDERQRNWMNDLLTKAQEKAAATPEGQAEAQKVAATDPNQPRTLPYDLQREAQHMQTAGAMYYLSRADIINAQMSRDPSVKLVKEAELQRLQAMVNDETLDDRERVTLGGKIKALEVILGRTPEAAEGVSDFNTEVAAVDIVRKLMRPEGKQQMVSVAEAIRLGGDWGPANPELADRILAIVKQGGLPEVVHSQIMRRVAQADKAQYKGVDQGSRGIINGQVVQVIGRKGYGLIAYRNVDGTGGVQYGDVAGLIPLPEPGSTLKTADGKLVEVGLEDAGNGYVGGTDLKTGEKIRVPLNQITEIGSSEEIKNLHDFAKENLSKVPTADLQPVPPVKAVTTTGEPVTITAVGKKAVKARTRGGVEKTLPREEVARSTNDKQDMNVDAEIKALKEREDAMIKARRSDEALVAREKREALEAARASGEVPATPDQSVTTFAPGTIPDPGNKLLFFRARHPEAFEQAFQAYKDGNYENPQPFLDHMIDKQYIQGVPSLTPHVIPQPISEGTPGVTEGYSLYGWEAPAGGVPMENYSPQAKAMLDALKGKGTVEYYNSPVKVSPLYFAAGRLFRIPDELVKSAVGDIDLFGDMGQADQTKYLRNLLNLNVHVDHEVAQAQTEVRESIAKATQALKTNDGEGLVEADAARGVAMAKAAQAALKTEMAHAAGFFQRVLAHADPRPDIKEFLDKGYTPETAQTWHNELAAMEASPARTLETESAVADSRISGGQRLYITKRTRPTMERTAEGLVPGTKEYYEMVPVDYAGQVLREGIKEADTPQEVADHITAEGYTHSLYKQYPTDWVHKKNPNLVASIVPARGGGYLAETFQRGKAAGTIIGGKIQPVENITPEEEQFLVKLAERHQDVASGETRLLDVGRKLAASKTEAEAWLREQEYGNDGRALEHNWVQRFAELPKLSHFTAAENPTSLRGWRTVASNLDSIIRNAVRLQKRIPDPVVEYAADFARLYEKNVGKPPFSSTMRSWLGVPSIRDLAPDPTPKSIDLSNIVLPNLEYQKGMTAPSPKLTRVHFSIGDEPLDPERALEISPEMHTSATVTHMPDDYTTLPTQVLGVRDPRFEQLDAAAEAAQRLALSTKWAAMWEKAKNLPESGPKQFSTEGLAGMPLARFKGTGQPVLVVDASGPIKGEPHVLVRFPDGSEMSVQESQVDIAPGYKNYDRDMRDYALAGMVLEGKYHEYFPREPGPGYGEWEVRNGLVGAKPWAIEAAMVDRARKLANNLIGTGTTVEGTEAEVNELMDMYNRALWIKDIPGPVAQSELPDVFKIKQPTTINAADAILKVLKNKDPKLEKSFKFAAYEQMRAKMGDTPYGDVIASMASGNWKPNEASQEGMDELRKAMGVSKNLPDHIVVQKAIQTNMIQPETFRIAKILRNERGFFKWASSADLPPDVKIELPHQKDIGSFRQQWGVTWKMVRRHPLSLLVNNIVNSANVSEQRYMQQFVDLSTDLAQNGGYKLGFQSEDSKALRQALITHDTWDDALKAGVDQKYQYGYQKIREYLSARKDDHVRYFLQRNIQPVYVDLTKMHAERAQGGIGETEALLAKRGININDVSDGFALLERTPRPQVGAEGEKASSWDHDSIESFVSLLKQYDRQADLPPGTDPRFVKDFDFWKRYGIKNYVPLIHNGNIALVTADRGPSPKLVGLAPSYIEAAQLYRDLLEQGRVGDQEKITFEPRGPRTVDDIDSRSNIRMGKREWERIQNDFAEYIKQDGEEVRTLFLNQRLPPDQQRVGPGTLASAKPRTAGLESPYQDLMRDLMVYTSRIARSQYKYRVSQANGYLEDYNLDRSLSTAHNVAMLHGGDAKGMPRLLEAMRDYLHTAVGEETPFEEFQDQVQSMLSLTWQAPKEAAIKAAGAVGIGEGSPIPWGELLNPKTYYEKYAARQRASDLVAFNAHRKLLGNPMSAFANYFQWMLNVVPKTLEPGMPIEDVIGNLNKSVIAGHKLWYANTFGGEIPENLQGLYSMMRDIGVDLQPAKQLAGGGYGWGDATGKVPSRAGRTPLEYGGAVARFWGMLPFNGGEEIGRFIAGIHAATREFQKAGIEDMSVASVKANPEVAARAELAARHLVDQTYFRYDALAMPRAFQKLGPAGRLLFQFKPYVLQQMGYEADMFKAMLNGEPGAARQFAAHWAVWGLLGGMTGLLYHPLLTYAGGLTKLLTGHEVLHIAGMNVPLTPEALEAMNWYKRRAQMTPEQTFQNTMNYKWDDILQYGLPGALGVAAGERIGVSGQDFLPDFSGNGLLGAGQWALSELGPTFGVYPKLMAAWSKYVRARGSLGGTMAGIGGALAGQQLGRLLTGGGAPMPLFGTAGGLIGATLASHNTPETNAASMGTFLKYQPEGRDLLRSIYPTEAWNIKRAMEIANTGAFTNMDGEPEYFAASDRTQEALAMLAGATSIQREEYQGVKSYKAGQSAQYDINRQLYIKEAANYAKEGDRAKEWETILRAQRLGIFLTNSEIQDELQNLVNESMNSFVRRQAAPLRNLPPGEEPTNPR